MFERAKTVIVAALAVGLPASADGKELRVGKADVPSAVLAAVSARYPKGTMTQFAKEESHGKILFEVTVELEATRREIDVSSTGKILAEERTLPFQEVPSRVREAFARSPFGHARILRAEESTQYVPAEKVSYELLVKAGERKFELVYDAKGKLVGREPGEED